METNGVEAGRRGTEYGQDAFRHKDTDTTDTTSFFTARNKNEAHYLCALLNSTVMDSYIRSFSSGGRGFGAPSVMKNIAIPEFDPSSDLHVRLAQASQDAHERVARGETIEGGREHIDSLSRDLWSIKG